LAEQPHILHHLFYLSLSHLKNTKLKNFFGLTIAVLLVASFSANPNLISSAFATGQATITICKDASPESEQDFTYTFSGNGPDNFALDDDGDDLNDLPSCRDFIVDAFNTYSFTEDHLDDWFNDDIQCTGTDPSNVVVTQADRKVDVTPQDDETVVCTFYNSGVARIIIEKTVLGGDGKFDFVISSNAENIPVTIETQSGSGSNTSFVDAGISYSVVEGELSEFYKLVSVSCVDEYDNPVGVDIAQGKGEIFLNPGDEVTCSFTNQKLGKIAVYKFYDLDLNGEKGLNEVFIYGWKIAVDGVHHFTFWGDYYAVGPHEVKEFLLPKWINTTPKEVTVNVEGKDRHDIKFGNVCTGAGGGKTPGFWSNKNGAKEYGADDNAAMVALHLVNADGSPFDPTGHASFKTWLLDSNAVNMAYKLSSQLAAMKLNVLNGKVNPAALIYAPGTNSANAAGFATVADIIAEADAALGADGYTPAGDPNRSYQEALKNAIDAANNNQSFLQGKPCKFSFY
jgi:hypothetical protein